MSDSTNICLACGICCDGTLIGFVELSKEEIPAVKKVMDIEEEIGNGFFLQPCDRFCEFCTIYEDRPKQCGLFECGLLKAVDQKERSFESAVAAVVQVKESKASLEEKIAQLQFELKSPSFYFRLIELKNLLQNRKSEINLSPAHLELIADIAQYDNLISENFGVA